MPRLFTGLRLSPSVSQSLALKQSGLLGARWIDQENLHITISFAGDMEPAAARDVMAAFDQFGPSEPFQISIGSLDAFGGDRPRAVIAHVEGGEALKALKLQSDGAMRRAGVDFDHRRFTPHVTLARLRHCSSFDVADYLSGAPLMPQRMMVRELVLFSSRDSRGGGPYREEMVIELENPYADEIGFDDLYPEYSTLAS